MKEERYLQICLSANELGPNIKKIIMIKLKEKYLYREIDGKMISIIQKRHWPSLMSTFSSSLQAPFLVTFPFDLVSFFKHQDIDSSSI